jgi:thiol-disulfide isomerase/thioredoxin
LSRPTWRLILLVMTFSAGASLLAQEQPQQATSSLDPAAQQILKQGEDALAARHYEEAEKAFKKANKIQHDMCVRCWFGLAQVQGRIGELDEAVKSAGRGISVATHDSQRAEGHVLRGYCLLQMSPPGKKPDEKKLKEADVEYRTAIQLDEKLAESHLGLAMVLFKELKDAEGKEEINHYLQVASKGESASFARSLLENPRRAREEYAPEFQVVSLQGEPVALRGLAGKYVVLDFWATWCPPCRASVGELKELSRKYPRDDVVLVSVSADEDERTWREFVAKKNMDWLQYRDQDKKVLHLFNVHAFPTYIVIDREGIIRERIVGENPQQSIVFRLKDTLARLAPLK